MAWTKEQEEAINTEGTNIIVSAGAGSGKTAVLTARVQRKLLSGVHINELLVLTFTNAAAAEMKERIRKTINKTEGLENEKDLVDSAYITTFDSFALSIVKKYHTYLNITNKIKITDQAIIDIKKNEILDEIFDEYYLSPKKKFLNLINNFCLKDDKNLKDSILNIYKKIELKYDKDLFLDEYLNNFFTDYKINEYIKEYTSILMSKKRTIRDLINKLDEYFDGDFVAKVEDSLSKLLKAKCYDDFKELDIKTVVVPKNSPEEGKRIKSTIFEIVKQIKGYCIYDSEEEIKDEIYSTRENVEVIIEILKELNKRLNTYKLENEIFNFNDIAYLAIKVVLENYDIREELTNSFNEILVDEYQDTNDTQERFISLISKNNVYMVGDIKQSIYRFRNANPYIFKSKYDSYSNSNKGIKIDLLKNFRSRDNVLQNINLLFDLFMDDEIGGADYKVSHRMIFGNNTYINEGKTDQNYDMDIITYNDKEIDVSKDEEEAFIIGNDIKTKIENKFQIFDKDNLILRDVEYNDFVILLDKSKNFELYKKVFEYLHIPISILKDESLNNDQDIYIFRNLLKLIICIRENRYDIDFKYNFTSISRSFLLKITDEEIYNYFINDNFKDSKLYNICYELSKLIDYLTPTEFFRKVLDTFNYEEKLLSIGNIKSYRVRAEYIYNLISSYSEEGMTIYDFINYLENIFKNDYDISFNINTTSSNSCKIMTIHKSKGLEFPICYYAGFSSRFNISELNERILFDNKYGIIIPKVDNYYKDTILKTLLKINTKKEEISERIRVLYVALTRAKEKMIIVMPELEEESEVFDLVPSFEREAYNSYLSIMKSIYSVLLPYIIKSDIKGTKDYLLTIKNNSNDLVLNEDILQVNEISINTSKVEESHYSKESLHIITKEEKNLLEYGTKVHNILEEIDFNNYDESIIEDEFIRNKISKFINNSIIKDNLNNKMYKEYEFIYKEDNNISHGIIDLLIECSNKMIIIDYKLKNIDDNNYIKQLNGYRKYIEEKTNKETYCYLYSIIDEEFKEIKKEI